MYNLRLGFSSGAGFEANLLDFFSCVYYSVVTHQPGIWGHPPVDRRVLLGEAIRLARGREDIGTEEAARGRPVGAERTLLDIRGQAEGQRELARQSHVVKLPAGLLLATFVLYTKAAKGARSLNQPLWPA